MGEKNYKIIRVYISNGIRYIALVRTEDRWNSIGYSNTLQDDDITDLQLPSSKIFNMEKLINWACKTKAEAIRRLKTYITEYQVEVESIEEVLFTRKEILDYKEDENN